MATKIINSRKRIAIYSYEESPGAYLELQYRFYYRNCFGKLKSTWTYVCRIGVDYNDNAADNEQRLLSYYDSLRKTAHRKKRNRKDFAKEYPFN